MRMLMLGTILVILLYSFSCLVSIAFVAPIVSSPLVIYYVALHAVFPQRVFISFCRFRFVASARLGAASQSFNSATSVLCFSKVSARHTGAKRRERGACIYCVAPFPLPLTPSVV